jgi:hypothetical protein
MVIAMRRSRHAQLGLLVTFVVVCCGLSAIALPASSATRGAGKNADNAVKALVDSGLVRAEMVTLSAGKARAYRADRGVVRRIRGRVLSLAERDGSIARINLSPATEIRIDGRKTALKRVRPGMRVTTLRKDLASALWLYAASKSPDKYWSKVRVLISASCLRVEVISLVAGELVDSRADMGVIGSAGDSSLTLTESDGTVVAIPIDITTEVRLNNKLADSAALGAGMLATAMRIGEGPAIQVWASNKTTSKKPGPGKK